MISNSISVPGTWLTQPLKSLPGVASQLWRNVKPSRCWSLSDWAFQLGAAMLMWSTRLMGSKQGSEGEGVLAMVSSLGRCLQ